MADSWRVSSGFPAAPLLMDHTQYIKIRAHLIYITLLLGTPIDAKEQYGIYAVDEAKKNTFDILEHCA